ncbi:MAG TPA: hypothetical protein VG273_02475 [Bryobacteraceae bacterium]|nr:hypothetical protein [Bryobacteraceae bacterium]
MLFGEIRAAEQSADWEKLVEIQKRNVRAACNSEYPWDQLLFALVKAHRTSDAVLALEDMDSRNIELNPSTLGATHPEIKGLLDTPAFKATPAGRKLAQLEKISDDRRMRFRRLLNAIPANRRPPVNYIAKGACPFECCRYGDWSVLEDTVLFAAPGSKQIAGRAKKGSRAAGLTGEVHLTPVPVAVLKGGDLPKDSIAFVLDYAGEGFGNVYTNGKIASVPFGTAKYCFTPSDSCWGEILFPDTNQKKQVWWVRVKLANGTIGWTDKPDNFGDKDACG